MTYGVAAVTVNLHGRPALEGVTLRARPGAVTAVVGGDGAGKTTLLRTLVGLLPASSGTVSSPDPQQLGYLPASAGSWRHLSVQENVDFVAGTYGLTGSALAERSRELLVAAGLDQFRDRLASQLSGGMRRKLGFVLAALHRPELLVLDEPSTGVDPVSRVDLWRLTAAAASSGAAVVMSTTYLDEAERAVHLLVLDRGRELVAGPPGEVLASLPGVITVGPAPVRREWAWRRGAQFHEWWPAGDPPAGAAKVAADLEDIVIARTLQRSRDSQMAGAQSMGAE